MKNSHLKNKKNFFYLENDLYLDVNSQNSKILRFIIIALFIPIIIFLLFQTKVSLSAFPKEPIPFIWRISVIVFGFMSAFLTMNIAKKSYYSFYDSIIIILAIYCVVFLYHFNVFGFEYNNYRDFYLLLPYYFCLLTTWFLGYVWIVWYEKKARPVFYRKETSKLKFFFLLIVLLVVNYFVWFDLIVKGVEYTKERYVLSILLFISMWIILNITPFIIFTNRNSSITIIKKSKKNPYSQYTISLALIFNFPIFFLTIYDFINNRDLTLYNGLFFAIQLLVTMGFVIFLFFDWSKKVSPNLLSFIFSILFLFIWLLKLVFDTFLKTNFFNTFLINVFIMILINIIFIFKTPKLNHWIYKTFLFFCFEMNVILIIFWILQFFDFNLPQTFPFKIDFIFSSSLLTTPIFLILFLMLKWILTISKINYKISQINNFNTYKSKKKIRSYTKNAKKIQTKKN